METLEFTQRLGTDKDKGLSGKKSLPARNLWVRWVVFSWRLNSFSRFSGTWMLVLGAFSLLSFSALAQTNPPSFEAANRLYFEGKFSEAATTYAILLQSNNQSASLYYNWGNALFKSGQIGRAISAYRQAERLTPRDPDVIANLQFARNQVQAPTLAI